MSGARSNYWSVRSREIQDQILLAWQALPDEQRTPQMLRSLLVDAYPFGERKMWPYQMWLAERAVTMWRAGLRGKPEWLRRSERSWTPDPPKEQMRMDLDL